MATWVVQWSAPAAGLATSGQAAFVANGLSIDDSVTGTGNQKSVLDYITGSSNAIKVSKYLGHLQRYDRAGREYRATSDGGSTFISALI